MRYLFFDEKRFCYDSPQFFISAMVEALSGQGHECLVCNMEENPELSGFTRTKWDGIFAFNSKLPMRKTGEDGEYYVDKLDGPFYNWILDHPLYHHPILLGGAKNHHVLTLDEKHTLYLKKYYKNLSSVATKPLFTMPYEEEKIRPLGEREIDFLFTGTYTPQARLALKLKELPEDARRDIRELIDIMEADFSLSPEEALQKFLDLKKAEIPPEIFREFLWRYYLADAFVAARNRERVISDLLKMKVPLTVCGHGWEKLDCPGKENLTVLKERNFADSLELAYKAKVLLNIMPNFKAGLHDRILTAMGHGAVSLSDETSYLIQNFQPNRELLIYSFDKNRVSLSEQVEKIRDGSLDLQAVADAGHRAAETRKPTGDL